MQIVTSETKTPGHWYAVRCQPKKEQLARLHLINQGFGVFLPGSVRSARPTSGRPHRGPNFSPLFPGYLFVQLDLAAMRWRAVNSTIGVLHLVQFGDAPARLPMGAVEALMAMPTKSRPTGREQPLARGTAVRILEGPFAGWISAVERSLPTERVVLLLQLMSRETEVVVPRHHLAKVA